MTMARFFAFFVAVMALAGCGTGDSSQQKTTYSYVDEDQAKAAKQGANLEDPSKIAPAEVTKADLAKLQKSVSAAQADYKAKPSPAAKKKLVDLTVELAKDTENCSELSPHEKYAGALRLFRQALTLDPSNAEAKNDSDTIVTIYHQMGRPVPQ